MNAHRNAENTNIAWPCEKNFDNASHGAVAGPCCSVVARNNRYIRYRMVAATNHAAVEYTVRRLLACSGSAPNPSMLVANPGRATPTITNGANPSNLGSHSSTMVQDKLSAGGRSFTFDNMRRAARWAGIDQNRRTMRVRTIGPSYPLGSMNKS